MGDRVDPVYVPLGPFGDFLPHPWLFVPSVHGVLDRGHGAVLPFVHLYY